MPAKFTLFRKLASATVLTAVIVALAAPAAGAATLTVTNTLSFGTGSLRDRIGAANATDEPDVIEFADGVSGLINLLGIELVVTRPLEIRGPGADLLTVDGTTITRHFNSSSTLALSGMKLSRGHAESQGGSINTPFARLTLSRVVISGSTAGDDTTAGHGGAIFAFQEPVTITDSTLVDNVARRGNRQGSGGAVESATHVNVTRSTFSANVAEGLDGQVFGVNGGGLGGAIHNTFQGAVTTIVDSLFVANRANGWGAAGGAVATAVANATNSTFTRNQTGTGDRGGRGALYAVDGGNLNHVTIAGNTAGGNSGSVAGLYTIRANGVTVRRSIVARNFDPADALTNCGGGALRFDTTLNLEDDAQKSCGFDLPAANPLLGSPEDNGGPTRTMALLAGSPAINAVPQASCNVTTDQRGLPRPGVGKTDCDLGAYETQLEGVETCDGLAATITGSGPINGTPGDDVIVGSGGADTIDAGGGNDRVCAGDGDDRVTGGPGDDRLRGEGGNDRLFGGNGATTADPAGGNDLLDGAAGNDRLFGEGGNDENHAGDGNDIVSDAAGNDSLFGDAGNDQLASAAGNDTISGGDGDDPINAGAGTDTCDGGNGTDTDNLGKTRTCETRTNIP